MPGIPGSGGPPPKRSDKRRRRNKAPDPDTAELGDVNPPDPDPDWHPVAVLWFESLGSSGQSVFYTNSDWGTAYLIAESISRELKPQPLVIGKGEDRVVEWVEYPPKGASLAAWLKGMTALMVTEGDRRRLRLELERSKPEGGDTENVSFLDAARRRSEAG